MHGNSLDPNEQPPTPITEQLNPQPSHVENRRNPITHIIVTVLVLVVVIGAYFFGLSRSDSQGKLEINTENITDRKPTGKPTLQPTQTQEVIKPVVYTKSEVTPPATYGFTNSVELKGIGLRVKLPPDATVSLQDTNFYVVKVGNDTVTFALKPYDGLGRRAWFQKEYPSYKDFSFTLFNSVNHSGYIVTSPNVQIKQPGAYFYFAAVSNTKMLVINGLNNINGTKIFFGGNLNSFKSFVSATELISTESIALETAPERSDYYRWSIEKKTVWEDAELGVKITAPVWTEMRYPRDRDANGNFTYTEWTRISPDAKIYESSLNSLKVRKVDVTGAYVAFQSMSILPNQYQGRSFEDLVYELLIPAGFCASEWKISKSECTSTVYCYTKEEVISNLIVKKQIKIGALDAQLRNMNRNFSEKNDCRAEDTWVIKAKNGQFILSSIAPDSEIFSIESL